MFRLQAIGAMYDQRPVLHGISGDLRAGEFVALAGPNGAGKSTLLRILAGLHKKHSGMCLFQGRAVESWPAREYARQVAFVPQSVSIAFPFSVEQIVMMGRDPHQSRWYESPEDRCAVERALTLTDVLPFRHRDVRTLSGGERQRVLLAAALAQVPRVLLLDEPTTFLDLRHQVSFFALLRDRVREGMLVLAVTHDLNLAAAYCDRVLLLREGLLEADAAPQAVFTPDQLARVFAVSARVHTSEQGRPWMRYGE